MGDHRLGAGQQLRRLAVVALVLGTALLAGCSSDEPRASETLPTESPTTTTAAATTTPELPPLGPVDFPVPAEARTQDEAGAEAFLRYYIDLINHQQGVPEGEYLRRLGPDCRDCLAIARRLDQAAEDGLRLDGGTLSIQDAIGTSFRGANVEFSFIVDVKSAQAYDRTGAAIPDLRFSADNDLSSGLGLVWSSEDQSWLVEGLTLG